MVINESLFASNVVNIAGEVDFIPATNVDFIPATNVDYIPATNVTWILFRRPVFIFHLS
jgi:hypothetical protein